MDYYLDGEVLYERLFHGTLLRCLSREETRKTIHEIYEGIYAPHINGHMMPERSRGLGTSR